MAEKAAWVPVANGDWPKLNHRLARLFDIVQTNQDAGAGGSLTDGDKGDITVSASGATWNIDAGAVTTAELGGDITAAGRALLDDADAAAQRTTLGLGTAATTAASAYAAATHATTHKLGGADSLMLHEFANPTGSVEFNQQQALQFRVENRTSDPGSPAVGQLWLRTDL